MENINIQEIENTLIDMIRDYLYYGYTLKFFLDMKYPIVEIYGEENLKELWYKVKEKMGSE
jgi:hypothetical protein